MVWIRKEGKSREISISSADASEVVALGNGVVVYRIVFIVVVLAFYALISYVECEKPIFFGC